MPKRATFVIVWVLLLALLGASMAVARLHLGPWSAAVNLAAAGLSAGLIAWFDMHLVSASGILRLVLAGLTIWLLIMFGLGLADWLTR